MIPKAQMGGTRMFCGLNAMLLIPALAEARVVSVQFSAPTVAFGGFSFPGVGQCVKIGTVPRSKNYGRQEQEKKRGKRFHFVPP